MLIVQTLERGALWCQGLDDFIELAKQYTMRTKVSRDMSRGDC